jgi:DNA-directed RNA polymerase subunit RPC12/RpoP
MTWGFSNCGYVCTNCGKLIILPTQLIAALPDKNQVECPYCNHVDVYDKSSIQNIFGKKVIP